MPLLPDPRHGSRSRGFTLIEMIVVISVIAILVGIVVPNFVASRAIANEAAIVGTLRTLTTAEHKFRQMGLVDVDKDSMNEFGTLTEMCGYAAMRGTTEHLAPTVLSLRFSAVDARGWMSDHGYYVALYLPDATGLGLPEKPASIPSYDPKLSADYFTIVAWPMTAGGNSGRATYFVNQQNDILKCDLGGYAGATKVPNAGCALIGAADDKHIDSQQLAVNANGADGNRWVPVH